MFQEFINFSAMGLCPESQTPNQKEFDESQTPNQKEFDESQIL